MKVEGAVFVVSGGASGLGEAVTRMAAENGGCVSIWDMNQKKGNALVEELGAKVMFCKVNIANEEEVVKAVADTVEKFSKIDVDCNCAGVAGATLSVNSKGVAHPLAGFKRVIDINLIGTMLCATRCAEQMAKQAPNDEGGHGLIINVASVAALEGQNGQLAYSASKGGVLAMALPMARDLSRYGIRVNTICPGVFDTPMSGAKKPVDQRDPSNMAKVQKSLLTGQLFPNQRFGRPSEIAHLVKAMVEIPFFNAEHVRLDAGIRMPKL